MLLIFDDFLLQKACALKETPFNLQLHAQIVLSFKFGILVAWDQAILAKKNGRSAQFFQRNSKSTFTIINFSTMELNKPDNWTKGELSDHLASFSDLSRNLTLQTSAHCSGEWASWIIFVCCLIALSKIWNLLKLNWNVSQEIHENLFVPIYQKRIFAEIWYENPWKKSANDICIFQEVIDVRFS